MIKASQVAVQRKNTGLAVILSLLITGLGQVYLGQVIRGLAFILSSLAINIFLEPYISWDQAVVIGAFFSILSAIDAYFLAKKINRAI